MALMRYEPWRGLDRLHNEMDRLFRSYLPAESDNEMSSSVCDWTPAVDVKEEDDRFLIQADIPGVDPKDIEVHMDKGMLTIKGERKSEARDEHNGYKRVERVYGSFFRRFTMPDTADAENIKAESKNGVLEIVIPKKPAEQPRRIEVS
jgi:HSP20 family protein